MKTLFNFNTGTLLKDVVTIASGTTIAQVIAVLLSPVITRMYGPEAYGVLGVFMSAVSILGNTSALSYPQAIILPKTDDDSISLAKISTTIALIIAFLLFIVIGLFKQFFIDFFNLHTIENYLFLLPLVVLFSGLNQTFQHLNIRAKGFSVIATVSIVYTLIKNISKVLLGFIWPSATTLVLISTFSILLQSALLVYRGKMKDIFLNISKIKLNKSDLAVAYKYNDFPLYRAPQTLFNSISQNLPVILLSAFFGPTISGFYSLSKSVLSIPIQFISKAVGNAISPRLSERYNQQRSLKKIIIKSTISLVFVGIIPFGTVIIFGPQIFEIIFGDSWLVAGQFARWMSVWLFFMFINRPAVAAIPVLRLQKGFLVYEVTTTVIKIIGLFIGILYFESSLISIVLYSLIGGLSYIMLIIGVIKKS